MKRTRTDIIKGNKRTLILSSKKQTNHKLIIIKGKKTRILSKEPTNHKLLKEPSEPTKRNKANQVRYYQRERILSKGPSEPGRILSKKPSEPLYYQRSQVNQNIIKGTERTLAKNYILAKEPTNKLENQAK